MTSAWDVTTGPGITALGLAAARSVESGRPDRLVEDPFARGLFEAAGTGLPMLVDWPAPGAPVSPTQRLHLHGSRYIGLRTRHYDDVLLEAAAHGVRQAVLLGAGLDTRGYRLELPATLRLFEADQPAVLGFKARVLEQMEARPRCLYRPVGADLRAGWVGELQNAGFDAADPTAWIAEGLLPYLGPAEAAALLEAVHEHSAPGSVLALDHIAGDPRADGRLADLSRRAGIDMQSLMAEGGGGAPAAALADGGWEVHEQPTDALARRYGRDLRDPFTPSPESAEPPWLRTGFVTARLSA
jgi:methyltransferase (TIGR00027 family)